MMRAAGIRSALVRFGRDESGTTLVEMAIVLPLFLVLLFGLIDFGRFAYQVVSADKAMQIAARFATVRPPACANVPDTNDRGSLTPPVDFGTSCTVEGACALDSQICVGDASNDTAWEIWNRINGILPGETQIEHLLFRYELTNDNRRMNFLGGPYTPTVTVELVTRENFDEVRTQLPSDFEPVSFRFAHPLSGLLRMSGAAGTTASSGTVPFPPMSSSLPGEDLAHGLGG